MSAATLQGYITAAQKAEAIEYGYRAKVALRQGHFRGRMVETGGGLTDYARRRASVDGWAAQVLMAQADRAAAIFGRTGAEMSETELKRAAKRAKAEAAEAKGERAGRRQERLALAVAA